MFAVKNLDAVSSPASLPSCVWCRTHACSNTRNLVYIRDGLDPSAYRTARRSIGRVSRVTGRPRDASVELIAISGMPPASLSTPPPDLNICFDQGSHAKIVIALVGDG